MAIASQCAAVQASPQLATLNAAFPPLSRQLVALTETFRPFADAFRPVAKAIEIARQTFPPS